MAKLNPEVKAKWVAALRSGKYTQGAGYLRTSDNKFCCLGVLCDLYAEDHRVEWELSNSGLSYAISNTTTALPYEVVEWLGNDVGCNDGDVGLNERIEEEETLIGLNDNKNFTFEQIAQVIEDQL